MKRTFVYFTGLCMSLFLMTSCGSMSNYTPNAEGFAKIQDDLKSKFGNDAYYSDISVIYSPGDGITLKVTVTKDPASLKMEEWIHSSSVGWKQTADVSIEIPEDTDAKVFMYQLAGKFDLKKIGELVEQSAQKLADEKQIKGAVLHTAVLHTADRPASEMDIYIAMEPENGGTSFNFHYDLDGNLTSFDY